jgi:hypothetical protein
MPKRPFKITVAVDSTGIQTPGIAQVDAVADLNKRFVLQYRQNLFGTNHLTMSVNSKGLLQTANAVTTSGLATLAQKLGTLAGTVAALAAAGGGLPTPMCVNGQTYTLIAFPEDFASPLPPATVVPAAVGAGAAPVAAVLAKPPVRLCNFIITAALVSPQKTRSKDSKTVEETSYQQGIFYKQDLSYVLRFDDGVNQPTDFLAYSPDESEIAFIPATASLFANNQSNITLVDGIVTAADLQTESEAVGLLLMRPPLETSSLLSARIPQTRRL